MRSRLDRRARLELESLDGRSLPSTLVLGADLGAAALVTSKPAPRFMGRASGWVDFTAGVTPAGGFSSTTLVGNVTRVGRITAHLAMGPVTAPGTTTTTGYQGNLSFTDSKGLQHALTVTTGQPTYFHNAAHTKAIWTYTGTYVAQGPTGTTGQGSIDFSINCNYNSRTDTWTWTIHISWRGTL